MARSNSPCVSAFDLTIWEARWIYENWFLGRASFEHPLRLLCKLPTSASGVHNCIGFALIGFKDRTASLHESINDNLKAIGACRAIDKWFEEFG